PEWEALLQGRTNYYADVTDDSWYAGLMNLAAEKGLLKGFVSGDLRYARGGEEVTRVGAGAMLSYLLNM
ncbi:MAG: hypothetical protein WCX95_00255, partial [Candidatus Gracilibacteria bacterium]